MGACQGIQGTLIKDAKGKAGVSIIKFDIDVRKAEEIKDMNKIPVNSRFYILQKNQKFRDNYTIGQSLGSGRQIS